MKGDLVARGGLLVLCKDDCYLVREAALRGLANHKKDKLLPALRFGLGDEVPSVAFEAARTLIKIGSEDPKAYDFLFRSVEDFWLGPGSRAFLKERFNVDFATRDEWRAWWAMKGNK